MLSVGRMIFKITKFKKKKKIKILPSPISRSTESFSLEKISKVIKFTLLNDDHLFN